MNKYHLPEGIGQGNPVQVDPQIQYYDASHSAEHFPIGVLFTHMFKSLPCVINVQKTYSEDLIIFLREKGKLIQDVVTIPNKQPHSVFYDPFDLEAIEDFDTGVTNEYKGGFVYKDSIIRFDSCTSKKRSKKLKSKKRLFTISIFYQPGTIPPLSDFDKFLYEEKLENIIHAVFRDEHGGIRFEPFETEVPKKFSIEKYYPEGFKDVHKHMVESLKQNEAGLYLLHGEPGTGKTTYIKYLSSQIQRDMIYVPIALIEALSDPSFLPVLLKKKQSVIVIEDAEKALLARGSDSSSSLVSSILNLTDGIMGNVYNISIIATYNSPRQDIDKALLRKGRLKGEYYFRKLDKEQSQKIMNENKIKHTATEPMSLADIFNVDMPEVLLSDELKTERRVGFFPG